MTGIEHYMSNRRNLLAGSAAAIGLGLVLLAPCHAQTTAKETKMTIATARLDTDQSTASDSIRPFHIHVPEEALTDLRRRLAATRWPTRELVGDRSQGVQLATLQELVRYWSKDYDWRKVEARLNAYPQ